MKKLFSLILAGLLVMGMVSYAMAEVDVLTEVDKEVDIDVDVETNIHKNVLLSIKQIEQVDTSAEADITKNADIGEVDIELEASAIQAQLLDSAFATAIGIISVNQAPGFANNQGNAVAIAYANIATPLSAFLNASVHVEDIIDEQIDLDYDEAVVFDDTITSNAFLAAIGVVSVNQAAGCANNQDNAVALALGTDPTASLAEVDLGMEIEGVTLEEGEAFATIDVISASAFSTATGVLSVNQASGGGNNQANCVAVTAAAFGGPF